MYYNKNKFCAFDLNPGRTNLVHNVLLGICCTCGIGWVGVTMGTNVAMTRKMRQPQALSGGGNHGNSNHATAKSAKKMMAFNRVSKVVAGVNCFMNLPFYVSVHFNRRILTGAYQ